MKRLTLLCMLFALTAMACTDDNNKDPQKPKDMASMDQGKDQTSDQKPDLKDSTPDTSGDMPKDTPPDMPIDPKSRVGIDLSGFVDGGGQGNVKAFESTKKEELVKGVVAHGMVGDYVLENDHVRFVVESNDRAMSPCPYGGNIIDAESLDPNHPNQDTVGEVCLLLNVGQTLKPEKYEILQDGSDGKAAVLAVTGPTALLDFLNFPEMAKGVAGGLMLNLPIDINAIMPLTVTQYYILRPNDRGVRVVTAFRNNGDEQVDFLVSNLLSGGGVGGYFNPFNGKGGFGYTSLNQDNLDGYLLPYLAYTGEAGTYAYLPKPDPAYKDLEDLPVAGSHITISGAAATVFGRDSVIKTILTPKSRIPRLYGAQHLKKNEVGTVEYQLFVGDTRLSSVLDYVYPDLGVDVGTVKGVVKDSGGQPVANASVTLLDGKDRAKNRTRTASDGTYAFRAPTGDYTVVARFDGMAPDAKPSVTIAKDAEATADPTVKAAGTLTIKVKDPTGQPVLARVTILCDGQCSEEAGANETDVTTNRLPNGVIKLGPTGLNGELETQLIPGKYRVVVSRGMEWSIWPEDATQSNGQPVEILPNQTATLDAEIAHVIDTPGVLSGDFHIHTVPSPDSAVAMENRVLSFVMEGVDVMVSTDHDIITDFAPTITSLGVDAQIKSIVGDEITTSDTGHFNGFPVELDPTKRRNGALDWGNGDDLSLLPKDIYAWVKAFPGEQVIQMNHPAGGTIGTLQVDVLRGISLADPTDKRLPVMQPDPVTGDTGLWSEDFTAMEVMNGLGTGNFWSIWRWWLIMIGRGFSPTGTAVTDTHQLHGNLGGAPRSYVTVPDGKDTIATFDEQAFVQGINEGRLIGSNGPFFKVSITNDAGQTVSMGETVETTGKAVTVSVDLEMPEWINVDAIDVYMNVEGIDTTPAMTNSDPLAPTQSIPVTWDAQDIEVAAQGNVLHKRRKKTVTFDLTTTKDAYVVLLVRGNSASMFPILNRAVVPMAFSNPIFLDADGGGYDKPHLLAESKTPPPYDPAKYRTHGAHTHHNHAALPYRWSHTHDHGSRPITREDIIHMIDQRACKHE